jgi:hypothetical protein
MSDHVPHELALAADRAFDALRPGTSTLDLQGETLSTLCFSDDGLIVDVILDRVDGRVDVQADTRQESLASMALEVVGPDGQIHRTATVCTFPARFEDVPPGLFSLVLTLLDPDEPVRATAWCRLAA